MSKFDLEKREKFVKSLKARGGDKPCSICGSRNFDLGSYVGILHVSEEISDMDATDIDTFLPCAARICTQCGHVDLFALYEYGMNK